MSLPLLQNINMYTHIPCLIKNLPLQLSVVFLSVCLSNLSIRFVFLARGKKKKRRDAVLIPIVHAPSASHLNHPSAGGHFLSDAGLQRDALTLLI